MNNDNCSKLLWQTHINTLKKAVSGERTLVRKTHPEKSRSIYTVFRLQKNESSQLQTVDFSTP